MSIAYIFNKYEIFLLMDNLNINYQNFSLICKPFFDEEIKAQTLISLNEKKFIIIDDNSIYIDKVILFIIKQLEKNSRLIKVNESLYVYVCPDILLTIQLDTLNTNIVKLTALKDFAMLKEEFDIELSN